MPYFGGDVLFQHDLAWDPVIQILFLVGFLVSANHSLFCTGNRSLRELCCQNGFLRVGHLLRWRAASVHRGCFGARSYRQPAGWIWDSSEKKGPEESLSQVCLISYLTGVDVSLAATFPWYMQTAFIVFRWAQALNQPDHMVFRWATSNTGCWYMYIYMYIYIYIYMYRST